MHVGCRVGCHVLLLVHLHSLILPPDDVSSSDVTSQGNCTGAVYASVHSRVLVFQACASLGGCFAPTCHP